MSSEEDVQSVDVAEEPSTGKKLNLRVEIKAIGPCRKHVSVTVPESDIQSIREESVAEFGQSAAVPGFRAGHVPRSLLEKRFRSELADQVKQKVLMQSLEQMSESNDLDPINQPEIDIESLDIPDSGDFCYEFDVEVRPEFDIPDYRKFTIDRPNADVSEAEYELFRSEFMDSNSTLQKFDGAVGRNDSVVADLTFTCKGKPIRESAGQLMRLCKSLRFQDAVLEGFDDLMEGAKPGDVRSTKVEISLQSPVVEMRGETVDVNILVKEVCQHVPPVLEKAFLEQFNCQTEDELNEQIRAAIARQVQFKQRQSTREQVLAKISESADWDLPESLVERQTENALRRELLEMAQAGFTREQIAARENEIRQNAIETTRSALKEHFVLDRIATKENIECEDSDIDKELELMSFQNGEPVRRIRARMVKSGMMENMEAQLRERKVIDFILEHATFNDVDRPPAAEQSVTAVRLAICGNMTSSLIDDASE